MVTRFIFQRSSLAQSSLAQFAQCCLVMLALLVLVGCPAQQQRTQSPNELSVQTVRGQTPGQLARWAKLLPAKQRTLAVFMTTWCESCERKQPDVVRWAKKNEGKVQTLFIISGSPLVEVQRMTKKRKIPAPLVNVLNDPKGNVASHYKIRATPTYVLLDATGKPLGRYYSIKKVPHAP